MTCTACDPRKFRLLTGSVCTCIEGYYETTNFECVKPDSCPTGYGI